MERAYDDPTPGVRYRVTPKGLAAKGRLTSEYLEYRTSIGESGSFCEGLWYRGWRTAAPGDCFPAVATPRRWFMWRSEDWTGSQRGWGRGAPTFRRLKVWPLEGLAGQEFDRSLVAVYSPADKAIDTPLASGIPRGKLVTSSH